MWDVVESEFGGRHELYGINSSGSTEENCRDCLFSPQAAGSAAKMTGFVERCLAGYNLDGWKSPDLTDPGELSYHLMRRKK